MFARAGKLEEAVSEYRAATWSPTYGYTRINLELGRALLVLGRPAEGIEIVRAGLRGGIDGSNLYVSRTELHELLAQLFDAARQRDSAVAHYTVVEHAWRGADPMLKGRYDAVVARLSTLRPNATRMRRSHDRAAVTTDEVRSAGPTTHHFAFDNPAAP